MKNYEVKKENIKRTITLIQMESGEIVKLMNTSSVIEYVDALDRITEMVENGNLAKTVGLKVEMKNGDWIKTDGKSVSGRNVTDGTFIKYLSRLVEVMRPLYVEAMNDTEGICDIDSILMNLLIDMAQIQEEYEYRW